MTSTYGCRPFGEEVTHVNGQLLQGRIGEEHLATRSGGAAGTLPYVEGWKAIELANSIFGFNGWSCSVVELTPDFVEEVNGRVRVGVTAVVKIVLKDGTFHEDVGFGSSEQRKKGMAIDIAKKEAVTDARKRALRFFGESLGNCVYDKAYLKTLKPGKNSKGELSYEGLRAGTHFINKKHPTVLTNVAAKTSDVKPPAPTNTDRRFNNITSSNYNANNTNLPNNIITNNNRGNTYTNNTKTVNNIPAMNGDDLNSYNMNNSIYTPSGNNFNNTTPNQLPQRTQASYEMPSSNSPDKTAPSNNQPTFDGNPAVKLENAPSDTTAPKHNFDSSFDDDVFLQAFDQAQPQIQTSQQPTQPPQPTQQYSQQQFQQPSSSPSQKQYTSPQQQQQQQQQYTSPQQQVPNSNSPQQTNQPFPQSPQQQTYNSSPQQQQQITSPHNTLNSSPQQQNTSQYQTYNASPQQPVYNDCPPVDGTPPDKKRKFTFVGVNA